MYTRVCVRFTGIDRTENGYTAEDDEQKRAVPLDRPDPAHPQSRCLSASMSGLSVALCSVRAH